MENTQERIRRIREQGSIQALGPQNRCNGARHSASTCPGFLQPLGRTHNGTALGPAGQRRSVLRPSFLRPQEEICSQCFPGPRGHCSPRLHGQPPSANPAPQTCGPSDLLPSFSEPLG